MDKDFRNHVKQPRKNKRKLILIIILAVAVCAVIFKGVQNTLLNPKPMTEQERIDYMERAKKEWQEELFDSPEFQQMIKDELNRQWYEKQRMDAEEQLKELDELGFLTSERRLALVKKAERDGLAKFLTSKNSRLAPLSEKITELPRWKEVVGIIGTETSFCTAGQGRYGQNNCGGIGGVSAPRQYASEYEGIKAISDLLQKPLYANKDIPTMNGTYCQDHKRTGYKCFGWDTKVLAFMSELNWEIYQLEVAYVQSRYQFAHLNRELHES